MSQRTSYENEREWKVNEILTASLNGSSHQFWCWLFEIVGPADFSEELNPECGDVDAMCQFSRLVIPWEDMMIVVPSFAHSNNWHTNIFDWIDFTAGGGAQP